MKAPKFSLDDFKKWMESQGDSHDEPQPKRSSDLIGLQVESKISERKLISRITVEDGEAEDLALDFISEGGEIIDVDGKNLLIEVDSGTFFIARHCVRRVFN